MTISEKSNFTEAGPELNINIKLAWNELKTFCMPESCALCPIGFQEFDCGRNTPFNDEDYNSRPSTCRLKLMNSNDIAECINSGLIINVGDTAAVRAICECVCVIPCREECRNICPFEDDCEFEECDDNNEKIFVTKVESIFNNGHGWMVTFEGLSIEARIEDLGTSFFVGEDAEQKAKEYEKTLRFSDLNPGDAFILTDDHNVCIKLLDSAPPSMFNAVDLLTGRTLCVSDNATVKVYTNKLTFYEKDFE